MDGKDVAEIAIPDGINESYFLVALGDHYSQIASKQSNPFQAFKKAKECYKAALERSPKFARDKYSPEAIQIRLELLERNYKI